jgi:hypothetical protein
MYQRRNIKRVRSHGNEHPQEPEDDAKAGEQVDSGKAPGYSRRRKDHPTHKTEETEETKEDDQMPSKFTMEELGSLEVKTYTQFKPRQIESFRTLKMALDALNFPGMWEHPTWAYVVYVQEEQKFRLIIRQTDCLCYEKNTHVLQYYTTGAKQTISDIAQLAGDIREARHALALKNHDDTAKQLAMDAQEPLPETDQGWQDTNMSVGVTEITDSTSVRVTIGKLNDDCVRCYYKHQKFMVYSKGNNAYYLIIREPDGMCRATGSAEMKGYHPGGCAKSYPMKTIRLRAGQEKMHTYRRVRDESNTAEQICMADKHADFIQPEDSSQGCVVREAQELLSSVMHGTLEREGDRFSLRDKSDTEIAVFSIKTGDMRYSKALVKRVICVKNETEARFIIHRNPNIHWALGPQSTLKTVNSHSEVGQSLRVLYVVK